MINIRIIKPLFLYVIKKKIKFFKTSFNNKNSISFSHIKILLTLKIFAPKMMELWSFFLSCFWGPLNFWGPQKRLKFWILDIKVCLKKLGIGIRLVWKKCPVSKVQHTWLVGTWKMICDLSPDLFFTLKGIRVELVLEFQAFLCG